MLKNNKILIIFLLSLVFIFSFSLSSFASSLGKFNVDTSSFSTDTVNYIRLCTSSVKDFVEEYKISYKYYFIFSQNNEIDFNTSGNIFYIVLGNDDIWVQDMHNGCFLGTSGMNVFRFVTCDTEVKEYKSFVPQQAYSSLHLYYTNYSSTGLVTENTNDTFFFPGQATLMTPMKVEEIPILVTKIIIILVPIGLIIFGLLFLVYLLKSQKWLNL